MSSVFRMLLTIFLMASATFLAAAPPLRVCADPNNLPFSNRQGQGFENKIATLVAAELHRPLVYLWAPQRRGFIRGTLETGRCDVIIGVPAGYGRLQTTRPYYRSSYVFVARRDRALRIRSFDDVRLRALRIGIQVIGDDYANPPPAQALAARWSELIKGFTGGNPEIQKGLNQMYADRNNWPASMPMPFGDDVQAFIAKAMKCK